MRKKLAGEAAKGEKQGRSKECFFLGGGGLRFLWLGCGCVCEGGKAVKVGKKCYCAIPTYMTISV